MEKGKHKLVCLTLQETVENTFRLFLRMSLFSRLKYKYRFVCGREAHNEDKKEEEIWSKERWKGLSIKGIRGKALWRFK